MASKKVQPTRVFVTEAGYRKNWSVVWITDESTFWIRKQSFNNLAAAEALAADLRRQYGLPA